MAKKKNYVISRNAGKLVSVVLGKLLCTESHTHIEMTEEAKQDLLLAKKVANKHDGNNSKN